jgi:hypothetical protein
MKNRITQKNKAYGNPGAGESALSQAMSAPDLSNAGVL